MSKKFLWQNNFLHLIDSKTNVVDELAILFNIETVRIIGSES